MPQTVPNFTGTNGAYSEKEAHLEDVVMLRLGIVMMGASLTTLLYTDRNPLSASIVVFLLVSGIVFVIIAPSPYKNGDDDHEDISHSRSTDLIRRDEQIVRNSPVRSRHAKAENTMVDAQEFPTQSGE